MAISSYQKGKSIIIIIIIIIIGLFQDKNIAVKDWIAFLNNIGVMCKKEQDIQYKKICKRKKKLKVLHMGTNIYTTIPCTYYTNRWLKCIYWNYTRYKNGKNYTEVLPGFVIKLMLKKTKI